MIEKVPVTEARAALSDLVSRVSYAGDRILLTRHGKPVAALISMAEYERVVDTLGAESHELGDEGESEGDEKD
ncbi:type II toxin-antitoxin system Phd/YefM family antitoxin [Kineococcus rhizosphaerae]|uniref:type II toxin-antitoxin system Phd/YefM family antitoxin n=1 Tax=Kineococcus rhizosphaerae TaxID=559628 RepID=UPI000D056EC9|nr:type II toxin-antitoxin system Phd/YefM family antitoxin [Kineococcus rhizosphaerae]